MNQWCTSLLPESPFTSSSSPATSPRACCLPGRAAAAPPSSSAAALLPYSETSAVSGVPPSPDLDRDGPTRKDGSEARWAGTRVARARAEEWRAAASTSRDGVACPGGWSRRHGFRQRGLGDHACMQPRALEHGACLHQHPTSNCDNLWRAWDDFLGLGRWAAVIP